MAKMQALATDVEELAEEIDGEKPDPEALDILAELGAFPGDDNWRFTVSQVLGASRDGVKEPQIYEGDASIIEGLHTRLRDEFGQGKFRVKVYKNKRLYARKDIEVASPPKAATPLERQSEMATVLAAMEKQNQRIIELLTRIPPQQQPIFQSPASDPFDSLGKIVAVMTGLHGIMKPENPAPNVTDAILKGIEIATKVAGETGNNDKESNWVDLIRDFLKSPIAEAMAQQSGQVKPPEIIPPGRQVPTQPLPQGQAGQASSRAQGQAQPPQPTEQEKQIRDGLLYLVTRAQNNSDPEVYAEWVFDNWPRDMLATLVKTPNLLPLIHTQIPETRPYTGWFKTLIDELTAIVEDAATEDASLAPGQAASAGNADGNSRGAGRRGNNVADYVATGQDGEEEPDN